MISPRAMAKPVAKLGRSLTASVSDYNKTVLRFPTSIGASIRTTE